MKSITTFYGSYVSFFPLSLHVTVDFDGDEKHPAGIIKADGKEEAHDVKQIIPTDFVEPPKKKKKKLVFATKAAYRFFHTSKRNNIRGDKAAYLFFIL